MAPENSSQTAVSDTQRITQPGSGNRVTLTTTPGSSLSFEFDPSSDSSISREGNSLVFEMEDGGSIVLNDFFAVGDESLPAFVLPDGTTVASADILAAMDIDIATAAGPTASSPAAGSGSGSYRGDAGDLIGGVDRLGDLGPFHWGRSTEVPEYMQGLDPVADLTIGTGDGTPGLMLSANNVNESESGFTLFIQLNQPVLSEVVIVIQVGGNAAILQQLGADQEYRSDLSIGNGVNYSFDPATGLLTITIPPGTTLVEVPVQLLDDHINDGDKNVTFTVVDTSGPVTGETGQSATVTISEDTETSHEHTGDNESHVLDGPIVGIENVGPASGYEGQPGGASFTFLLTLTDPHSGDAYAGYKGDGLMSQDMTVTFSLGGDAHYGDASGDARADYHLMPTPELLALIEAGKVEVELNPDGSIKIGPDGTFTLTLKGRVDADGNLNDPDLAFTLDNLSDLAFTAEVHINGSGPGEGAEDLVIGLDGVTGNESQVSGSSDSAGAVIEADPVLSLRMDGDTVNESEHHFSLVLSFDKPLDPGATVTVTLRVGGDATLWDGDAATEFSADYFLAQYPDATIVDNGDGTITITVTGDAFQDNGSGGYDLQLDFPLNDDHITENDEIVSFTIDNVTVSDGVYTGGVGGQGGSAETTIVEDTRDSHNHGAGDETGVLDGPVAGITVDNGSGGDRVSEANGQGFTFQLTLIDPHTGQDYAGYGGEGVLSQDMTLTVQVGGDATPGQDYAFDFSALEGLQDAGQLTFTWNPDSGILTITLHGRVDADGNPHGDPGRAPFDLGNLADLKIEAAIIDDAETEVNDETIVLTVSTDGGNESSGGGSATGTIEGDTAGTLSGPYVHLVVDDVIAESGADDPAHAPRDNATGKIVIDLRPAADSLAGETATADEGVRMTIKIGGGSSTAWYGAANPEGADELSSRVDYYLSGQWEEGTDPSGAPCLVGTISVTMENGDVVRVPAYRYDSIDPDNPGDSSTEISFEMPPGGVSAELGYTVNDDLYESEAGIKDSFEVTVELEAKATDANGDPVPYGEARLADPDPSGDGLTSNPGSTTILDDQRGGLLNPPEFDGPYVGIAISGGLDAGTIQESSGGAVQFTVSLTHPDGSGLAYQADEPVSVTLKISGSETFYLNDLFKPDAAGRFSYTIKVEAFDADGASLGVQDVVITGSGDDRDFRFTVTLPEGAASVSFELPVNDDPLGADENSRYDQHEETYSLEIVDIKGNEARGDDSRAPLSTDNVTILDDVPGEQALEGVQVGLVWTSTAYVEGRENAPDIVQEGRNYTISLKLYTADGTALTAGNNPYAGYFGGALPDDMVLSMNFSDTAGGGDLALKLTASLYNLIRSGNITIVLDDGTTLDSSWTLAQLQAFVFPDGDFTLTIRAGTSIADILNLQFQAQIQGDNVNEWEQGWGSGDQQYATGDGAAEDEQFGLSITNVTGNESSVKDGEGSLTGQITDLADGSLDFSETTVGFADGGWSFTINVSYKDTESNSPAHGAGVPGEAIHFRLTFSDSATMQHGEEYNVDAYLLFLSLNQGALGPEWQGLSLADYYEALQDLYDAYSAANPGLDEHALWRQIAESEGLILVRDPDHDAADAGRAGGAEHWDKGGSNTYDVYAPGGENEFSFQVGQGDHGGLNTDDGFTVGFENPYADGDPDFDMHGEIVYTGDDAKAVIHEKILLGIDGHRTIYEDHSDIREMYDTYTVKFSDGAGGAMGKAAANITFTLTLKPLTADLDLDTTDNHLPNMMGDFAFCDENGEPLIYSGLDSNDSGGQVPTLLEALNAWLADAYGTGPDGAPNVRITGAAEGENGQLDFFVDVAEGFDLSDGLSLHFRALDDNVTDSGELFGMQVSNVGSYTNDGQGTITDDPLDVGIDSNNQYTTIVDETAGPGTLNGFALGLVNGEGDEALDGRTWVELAVRAYILHSGGEDTAEGTAHGQVMTLQDLLDIYNAEFGLQFDYFSASAEEQAAFKAFVTENFGPTQNMTLNLSYADGTATHGEDYKTDYTSHTVNWEDWDLMVDEDGTIYFQTREGDGVRVETIDDNLQEGDETFTVEITGSSGNESRPLTEGEVEGCGPKGEAVIHDTHNGPVLLSFGPNGQFYVQEPVDREHGPVNGEEHKAEDRVVEYSIRLDSATSEPVLVWISIEGSTASIRNDAAGEYGDYSFGPGMCWYDGATVWEFQADGSMLDTGLSFADYWSQMTDGYHDGYAVPPAGGGYFTVIGTGEASASFEVRVRDDNITEDEQLTLTITDMQGSETRYRDEEGNPAPWADKPEDFTGVVSETVIHDDMQGPYVSIRAEGNRLAWDGTEEGASVTLTLQDYCSEDVTVTFTIYDADFNPIASFEYVLGMDSGEMNQAVNGGLSVNIFEYLQSLVAQGVWTQSHYDDVVSRLGDDFYLRLTGVEGGEARADNTPLFVDHDHGHCPIEIHSMKGDVIREGELPGQAGETASFTLDVTLDYLSGDTYREESFTITFTPGSAGNDDVTEPLGSVTVTFPKEALESMANGDYIIEITVNADGAPVVNVYVKDPIAPDGKGAPVVFPPGSEPVVDGVLPTAVGDTLIEGNEDFYGVITNPSSGIDNDAGPAEVIIEDQTHVGLVFLVPDGQGGWQFLDAADLKLPENHGRLEITAKLVLVDAEGNSIDAEGNPVLDANDLVEVTANVPLQFDLTYGPGAGESAATYGEDYTGDTTLQFGPGQSEVTFGVDIHEDNFTEGDETFDITGTLSEDSKNDYPGVAGQFPNETSSGGQITIQDNDSGPRISWYCNNATEGGAIYVNLESWDKETGARVVLDENAALTFEVTFDGDNPVDWSDIEYIEVDGVRYWTDPPAGEASLSQLLTMTGPNSWTFTVTFEQGQALGGFTIKTRNDVISEGDETFSLRLVDTTGGETGIKAGYDGPRTVTVYDQLNGPSVSLEPGTGSEETCTVSVVISLTGGDPTEEEGLVYLQLDQESMDRLANGDLGDISVSNGAVVESYDPDTGRVTIRLPEGARDGESYEVTFAIKDDSLSQERDFVVGLEGVDKGELSVPGLPGFTGRWTAEQGPVPGQHGGSNSFEVEAGGSLDNLSGEVVIFLQGFIPENGDGAGLIKAIVITDGDGVTRTLYEGADWHWDQNGTIVLDTGSLSSSYSLEVIYNEHADPDALAYAKKNGNVGGASISNGGPQVSVPVRNEEDGDPLHVSVRLDSSVVEGSTLAGMLVVQMANLPGDPDVLAGEITVQLQVAANPDGSYSPVLVSFDGGTTYESYMPGPGGTLTVVIPAGTPIDGGGRIELEMRVDIPDNSLTDNPDYTVQVTDVDAPAYEKTGHADGPATSTVTDNPEDSGPDFVVTVNTDAVEEGGSLIFTVTSGGDAWKEVPTGNEVLLTLRIEGYVEGDALYLGDAPLTAYQDGQGNWCVDVPMTNAGNGGQVTVRVETVDRENVDDRRITVSVKETDTFETVGDGSGGATAEVTSNDGVTLALAVSHAAVDQGDQLVYSIELHGQGNYFANPANGTLPAALQFTLTLGGLDDAQMGAVMDQLRALGLDVDDTGGGALAVTVPAGYAVSAGDGLLATLEFRVDVEDTSAGHADPAAVNDTYTASLDAVVSDMNAAGLEPGRESVETVVNLHIDYSGSGTGETIYGGLGDDTILGGSGDDLIYGGAGNDVICGGAGNDTIHAGSGNNLIAGGAGDDVLFGGTGSDTFAWGQSDLGAAGTPYTDVIKDFTLGGAAGDLILFQDIFGVSSMGDMHIGEYLDTGVTKIFSMDNGTTTLRAEFTSDNSLVLSLSDTSGALQTIEVEIGSGSIGFDTLDEEAARSLLEQIIKLS